MKYGWKRDLPDHRDFKLALSAPGPLPSKVDLKPFCPKVYNQGKLGSCTANAIGGLVEFLELKQKVTDEYTPSRLFIYYYERYLEHTLGFDAGAQLRDGMRVVAQLGAPHEKLWNYSDDPVKFKQAPPMTCYQDALKHKVSKYMKLPQDLHSMKSLLADGFPFVFGFTVYEYFESQEMAHTGILKMPVAEAKLGGHAVLAVGYNDETQELDVRNSWDRNWGLDGYFKMPYAYITNPELASDFWTGELVA